MNWKTYVERQNARTYVLPPGWDSRDTVAAALGCSSDRVDEHLKPGIKSGEIEKQVFRVWNADLKRINVVIAYREKKPDECCAGRPWTEKEAAQAVSLRSQGLSFSQIAQRLGRTKSSVSNHLRLLK